MKGASGSPPIAAADDRTEANVRRDGGHPQDLTGRTLGDFIVKDKIGEGGFGLVYRAEQPVLEREAVIKILLPDEVDTAMIQRFLREARLASRLDHPFAAHIYAFGAEPDGLLWIAMELVRGTPLSDLLGAQGPLRLHRFVPFFEKLCEVVQSAHEQGIVHRDLKPANVMVIMRAGRMFPKLLDLGIAKLRYEPAAAREKRGEPRSQPNPTPIEVTKRVDELSSDITQPYLALGSPGYMAPEQWTDFAGADARTDIYALGVLAYQCLSGRKPFEGPDSASLRSAHLNLPVPPLGPDFPPSLDDILKRAMAKQSSDRFDSALDFSRELRAASGLSDDTPDLPELDVEVRETLLAEAPQPLAASVALLESARYASKMFEAVRLTVRVAIRYLAMVAIASRARTGIGGGRQLASLSDLFQQLYSGRLSDAQWWLLAQELTRPFASCRSVHPIPEMVDLFFLPGAEALRSHPELQNLLSLGEASDPTSSPSALAEALSELRTFLKKLFFLLDYPLEVFRRREEERWIGLRRRRRHYSAREGALPVEEQFLLSDAEGFPVLVLSPLIQMIAPTPGAPEEAFFFDGNGRHGARLVAFPLGFERHDETFWSWFRQNVFDVEVGAVRREDAEQAPYVGLSSFTSAQARMFFGREREAESFANRLRIESLMGVVGPSGSGKSSFLQAGVVPLLPTDWRVLTVRPGPTPVAALAARLSAEGLDASQLGESLGRDANALKELLSGAADARRQTWLLVVDQFEELITLCPDPVERSLYAQALVQAAAASGDSVRVVVSLRDDFLIRVQQLPALRERLARGLHLLGTPQREDLLRILTMPARQSDYEFEDPDLPREMVDAVADQPGALALLSFTASRLWELRDRHLRRLTRKAYQAIGGVGGALAHHAEATLWKMQPDEQRLTREAFRHLVTAERTRAVLTRKEMAEVLGGKALAESVLEQLIHARLLVASEGTGGEDRVEVIHEALLASWPRLVRWQQEDAEGVRMRDALRAAARQWQDRGRAKGLLWRGEALLEYQLWRNRYPGSLTETEEAFAAASLSDERRGRRLRIGLLVAAFVSLVLGMVVLVRANGRAEANAKIAAERLMESHQEQGRQLLVSGKPQEAMAFLGKAFAEGAHGNLIQHLLGKAMRAFDGKEFTLEGHTAQIYEAHFSPDGSKIITASVDKTARIWNGWTGQWRVTLPHNHTVRSAQFSADGRRALTGSRDGTAKIWNAESGELLISLPHPPEVWWAGFNRDASLVLTAGVDRTARLWNAETGTPLATFTGHRSMVVLGAFSPEGTRIATAETAGAVRLWDAHDHRFIASLPNEQEVRKLEFSPDGRRLATVCIGAARIWSAANGQLVSTLPADSSFIYAAAFSPDGKRLATGGDDKTAKIWDLASGKLLNRLEGHAGAIYSVVFSPDGKRLLTSSRDATVRIWNAQTGGLRATLVGHMDSVWRAEFSPDGARALSASFDSTAVVWDGGATEFHRQLIRRAEDDPVFQLAFTAGGKTLVTTGSDNSINLWEAQTGTLMHSFSLGSLKPMFFAVSPDGSRVVTGNGQEPIANLWQVSTGQVLMRLTGHDKPTEWARFSPDGARIATADRDQALIQETATGRTLIALRAPTKVPPRVAFAPDGRRVATLQDNNALIWDASSGKLLLTLSGHRYPPNSLMFSADGRWLVTAGPDQSARLWDTIRGKQIRVFEAERQAFNGVAINRDATLVLGLASGGSGNVYIWDVESGKIVDVITETTGANDAIFSPAEGLVATASWGDGAKLWGLPSNSRMPSEISSWVQCHIPFHLEREQLIRSKPDPSSCQDEKVTPQSVRGRTSN